MKAKYNYVYGTAAPKIPYQPQREENQKTINTPKRKAVVQLEQRTVPLGQIIFCILMVFAIFFTLIFRFSALTELNCELAAQKQKHEQLKDENRKLQAKIGSQINLENVRRIAEDKLGMKMPDNYQRIPVKVPKVNYSLVTGTVHKEETKTLKSWIAAYFDQ
ncbi:MAG: septum formation initiator family protein [Bacillota bacterium]|jgi:cell division protein FtsL|nr:septum formation initiator family protein [Bacillota bacterium]NLV62177.1 cell division protein FtsL [Clostridiaceae bacterium]